MIYVDSIYEKEIMMEINKLLMNNYNPTVPVQRSNQLSYMGQLAVVEINLNIQLIQGCPSRTLNSERARDDGFSPIRFSLFAQNVEVCYVTLINHD